MANQGPGTRILAAIVAASLALLVPGHASRAQPATPEPAPDAPTEVPDGTAAPAPDAIARADYDDAFAAMIRGEFARAAVGFDGVAARAQDPQLIAAAREMARLARELTARKITFASPGGPSTVVPGYAEDRDEGRTSFVAWTTMYGIYAGVVAIDDFNIDDFRVGILTVTGTTAAGLFGSLGATRGRRMTGAMADAYSLGMVEGFANAGLLVTPIGLTTSEHVQTTLLLSGAAGAAGGLLYASELRPSRGQISFASSISLLGFASTGLGFGVVRPASLDTNTALIMMAAGTDVGLGAGLVLGRDLDWSVSRGRVVQLGALLGGLSGLAVGALITGANASSDDDSRILSGATLAGMWGGFFLAVRSTGGMTPDIRYFGTDAPPASPEGAVRGQLVPMALRGGGGLAIVGGF